MSWDRQTWLLVANAVFALANIVVTLTPTKADDMVLDQVKQVVQTMLASNASQKNLA